MKKIIALLLVLALAVSCFVGCNTTPADDTKAPVNTTAGNDTPDDTTAAPTESEDPYDGTHDIVELTWVIRNDPQEDDEEVFAAMNKLLEERYNLHVNIIPVPAAEYNDRMTLMITGNEDWDLCYTAHWTNVYSERVNMGAFYDLFELKDSPVWAELMEVYPNEWYSNAIIDGSLYAISNYQVEYSPTSVYIQKDLAEKYNLAYKNNDVIHDFTDPEMIRFLEAVRDNEPDIWPVRKGNSGYGVKTDGPRTVGLCNGWVDILADDTTDYKVIWGMKENKENRIAATVKTLELIQAGFWREDLYTVTDDTTDYKANRYACHIGTGKPGGEVETGASLGKEYIQLYMNDMDYSRSLTGGMTTMTAINYASKNPEAALKFYTVMWKDTEIYNMFLFGLEGEHYTKTGENRVELIPDSGYNRSGWGWGIANQFNAWLLPGQADDVWEQTIAMNEAAKPINVAGFNMDVTKLETELGNLATVSAEYKDQWLLCKNEDEVRAWYDEYLAKMEEAGIQTVLEETQRQIDAWRVANGK